MNTQPAKHMAFVKCFGGGSIAIYQSVGGLPIMLVSDCITHNMVQVEVKDTDGAKRLIHALNECAGSPCESL